MNSIAQIYRDSIIDIHAHLWDIDKSADEYFSKNKKLNIKIGGIVIVNRPGDLNNSRAKNDAVIRLSKINNNVIPICSVHPYDGDSALIELRRLKNLEVKIIKLHPITQEFDIDDERVSKIVEEAGTLGMVVLIDAYTFFQKNNLEKLIYLALRNRNTKFILAHMGGPEFLKFGFLGFLRSTNSWFPDNMWFDISGTLIIFASSPYKDELEWTMRTIGLKRILFGSDFPQFSVEQTIKALNKLNLTKSERKLILYSNAKRLLQLQ